MNPALTWVAASSAASERAFSADVGKRPTPRPGAAEWRAADRARRLRVRRLTTAGWRIGIDLIVAKPDA